MSVFLAPLVFWLGLVPAAPTEPAKLELTDIRPVYGFLGFERTGESYSHVEDILCYRFTVRGPTFREGTQADLKVESKLLDAKGKAVQLATQPLQTSTLLGGDTFPGAVELPLTGSLPPGKYEYVVTVTDVPSGATAAFRRAVKLTLPTFALRRGGLYLDAQRKVPAHPAKLSVGQVLFFGYEVVAPDPNTPDVDLGMTVRLLDAKTGQPLGVPVTGRVGGPSPQRPALHANFHGPLGMLTRPGRFVLKATFTDNVSGSETTHETPLTVTP